MQILWNDGERTFCRESGSGGQNGHPVLVARPTADQPLPACLGRFAHEFALKDELDSAWAVRPLEMVRENGRVHLLAISLGAMLAADWAAQYPHEVASVTLINSSAKPLSPFYRRLRWRNYPAILRSIAAGAAEREQTILQLTSARPAEHTDIVASWQLWQQQRPVSKLNALRQLWAASRFAVTPAPQCPAAHRRCVAG